MEWKNRRVLVTGATGLLGSHLIEWLNNADANIVAIVRDFIPNSHYLAGPAVDEVTGDVEDFKLVNRTISEYQVDMIFHLAAQTQVQIANRNPMSTFSTNIMGTVNVLEAARINNVKAVIVASSDKAYGCSPYLPYNEETPLRGIYPYDVSKSCVDLIAQSYAKTYHMNIGITRCGNLFGPGDLNFNRLIPGTIQSILSGQQPVIRSDGTMTRDYFYVKDAVDAYTTLMQRVFPKENTVSINTCHIYNFSYGRPYTVYDMVMMISKIMSYKEFPVILNEASHEIQEQYLDSSNADAFLHWQPKWKIEDALKETIEWYKENL